MLLHPEPSELSINMRKYPLYHDPETFWNVLSQSTQTMINQTDSVTQTEKDVVSQSSQTVINLTDSVTQTERANDGIDVYSQTENSQNAHPSKSIEICEKTVTNTNICETSAPLLSCTCCGKVKTFLYKYYVECQNLQRKGTCDCCIFYCEPCKVQAHQPADEWLLLVNKSLD